MTMPSFAPGPLVVKVGGGLLAIDGALDSACRVLARAGEGRGGDGGPLVVVPGGGPFADAVREFDRRLGLSPDAAHWMAILAMDQYAHVLAERIGGAELAEDAADVLEIRRRGRPAVLAPSRWMRSADVLPHEWEVTSDSIAAFIAGALDASRLVLVKPAAVTAPVDRHFDRVCPAGLPVTITTWDRLADALAAV